MLVSTASKIAIGVGSAIIGAAGTYLVLKPKLYDAKCTIDKHKGERDSICNEKINLKFQYMEMCSLVNKMRSLLSNSRDRYINLLNPDLFEEIGDLAFDERSHCYEIINEINEMIDYIIKISENDPQDVNSLFNDNVEPIIDRLKQYLQAHASEEEDEDNVDTDISIDPDDDDDEDDDEDDEPMMPILDIATFAIRNIKTGRMKYFRKPGPEEGYPVLEGSDIENGEFRILANANPELYNFLLNCVKSQVRKGHIVANINPRVFDQMMDDIPIIIHLSLENEEYATITAINAVIPFEIFKHNKQVYAVEDLEVELNDNIVRTLTGGICTNDVQDVEKCTCESCQQTEAEETEISEVAVTETTEPDAQPAENVDAGDWLVSFINESIGYNRDSLRSFIGKLAILMKADRKSGENIRNRFNDIIRSIRSAQKDYDDGVVNDEQHIEQLNTITQQLRTLISDMKKNHGNTIRAYANQNNAD